MSEPTKGEARPQRRCFGCGLYDNEVTSGCEGRDLNAPHSFVDVDREGRAIPPPLDLAAVRALCDAATPGPWRTINSTTPDYLGVTKCGIGGGIIPSANAHFIAESRTLVPALLAEVERLRGLEDERCRLFRGMQARAEAAEKRATVAEADLASERARFVVADDALAAAHEDVLTVVRGGKRDLGRAATRIDVSRQSIVLAKWKLRRLAGKKEGGGT